MEGEFFRFSCDFIGTYEQRLIKILIGGYNNIQCNGMEYELLLFQAFHWSLNWCTPRALLRITVFFEDRCPYGESPIFAKKACLWASSFKTFMHSTLRLIDDQLLAKKNCAMRDEERLSSAKLQNYNYFVGCRRKSFFIPHYILLQQTRKENISHAYQNNWENLLETSIPFSFSFFLFLCTSASCLFSCNFTGKLVSQLNNFTAATFSWTICITAINAS